MKSIIGIICVLIVCFQSGCDQDNSRANARKILNTIATINGTTNYPDIHIYTNYIGNANYSIFRSGTNVYMLWQGIGGSYAIFQLGE